MTERTKEKGGWSGRVGGTAIAISVVLSLSWGVIGQNEDTAICDAVAAEAVTSPEESYGVTGSPSADDYHYCLTEELDGSAGETAPTGAGEWAQDCVYVFNFLGVGVPVLCYSALGWTSTLTGDEATKWCGAEVIEPGEECFRFHNHYHGRTLPGYSGFAETEMHGWRERNTVCSFTSDLTASDPYAQCSDVAWSHMWMLPDPDCDVRLGTKAETTKPTEHYALNYVYSYVSCD